MLVLYFTMRAFEINIVNKDSLFCHAAIK